jgi:hypothetical protein
MPIIVTPDRADAASEAGAEGPLDWICQISRQLMLTTQFLG